MRARFLEAYGRHVPRCHGRCLYADVESEHSAVGASIALIVLPTVLFVLLMPLRTYWMLILVAIVLLVLSLSYLLLAMFTEPGILPIETPSSTGRRKRVTHCFADGRRRELSELRAKMCRQTENGVEEFDHFCPWVGNAVGRRNYRYFIAFVTTVSFLALVVGATSCIHLSASHLSSNSRTRDDGKEVPLVGKSNEWVTLVLMILVAYTLIVLCSVCGLMSYHFRLIAINQTTNENIRGTYFNQKNPYDRGVCRNCLQFATRPVPRSRVVTYVNASRSPRDGHSLRLPTEEIHCGEDEDEEVASSPSSSGIEMI